MRLQRGPYGPRREKKSHKKRWYLRRPRETLEDLVYKGAEAVKRAIRSDREREDKRLKSNNEDDTNQKQTVAGNTLSRSQARPETVQLRNGGLLVGLYSIGRPPALLPRKGSKAAKRYIESIKLRFIRSFEKPRKRHKVKFA